MDRAIDFVKSNPEVFAALVAAIGIVGGIAGNWISARVQAAGGKAQANAAVDAARITTEAERMAALREDRKVQIAAFIRCAREILKHTELMFLEEGHEEATEAGHEELMQLEGQLELVAPETVLAHAERVMDGVGRSIELAFQRGPGARAERALTRVHREGHPAAHRAVRCLAELRAAHSAGDENLGEQQAFRSAATTALDDVPSLTNEQKHLLVLDATWPPLDPALREITTARANAVRDLVSAARSVLGADRS